MNRTLKLFLAALLTVALLISTSGLVPVLAASKTVKTTRIRLSPSKTVKLTVGEELRLKVTLKPANSTQKIKWSSSNRKVATVSNGVIRARGKGTATITAKSGSRKASIKVKVSKASQKPAATPAATMTPTATTTPTVTATPEPVQNKTLVAYFSCTGTTKGVAQRLARVTGADLYEIVPAEPYTAADLNYGDSNTRATREQNHPETRPKLGGKDIDLRQYTRVYLGYPIWWGMEPRILCTFVETHDFTGITVIPFCTSGSSGIGRSGEDLAKLAGTGTWLKGTRHSGGISEEELLAWVNGLK